MYKQLILLFLILSALSFSCSQEKQVKPDPYNGPLMELKDMETLYTDSARLKIRVTAPEELEFQNGDKEFPKGIFMEFFDVATQKKKSNLKGNHAKYLKEKDVYIVTGDVLVKSLEEKKNLSSEELIWTPAKEEITTEKFVRIETPCEILTGDGMVSNEDFTSYRILKPKASIFLDCE